MEEETEQPNETSPNETEQQQTNLNKACEACRGSKLRCIIEPNSPDGSCKRCIATHRACIYKAPRVRQRRKLHVDARVAELERQLRSLRLQLHQAQHGPSLSRAGPSLAAPVTSTLRFEAPVTPASWPRKTTAVSEDLIPNHKANHSHQDTPDKDVVKSIDNPSDDVVQRNILRWNEADRLVQIYLADFATHYPFVTLPCFTDTESFRRNRPATFLAVLAAASVTSSLELNRTLNHELLAFLARRIMLEGEHNLDVVQAMIIMTIWYAPMDKFESLRHYQFAHLAATIAMDQGIGDKSSEARDERISDDLDRRRTLLGIYLLCAGISVTTGRPKMLRFTDYMQRCIGRLKSQHYISPQDQWFLAWVELQRLTETAADVFFTTPTDISKPANQQAVVEFCRKLEDWRDDLAIKLEGSLEIHYHYVRAIVLCVCLYVDHDMTDFRPPFRVRPLDAPAPPPAPLTPFLARTTIALIETVQSALGAFLSFNSVTLLAAPMIYYIRTLHPLSILLMLDTACQRPGNELSKIIDQDTLRVGEYFEALKQMLLLYESDDRTTPAKFLAIIRRMEAWWKNQSELSPDLRPFATLNSTEAQGSSVGDSSSSGREASTDLSMSPFAGRMILDPVAETTQTSAYIDHGNWSGNDDGSLLVDNWVVNMDQDPASFLVPEIDWALFENQELVDASG